MDTNHNRISVLSAGFAKELLASWPKECTRVSLAVAPTVFHMLVLLRVPYHSIDYPYLERVADAGSRSHGA